MVILDLKGSLEFSPERHVYTFLANTPLCSIRVVGWEPGQASPIRPTRGPTRSTTSWKAKRSSTTDAGRHGTRMVLYHVQAGADRHPEPLDAWPAP
jgi:hypothetical protein